jgi:hypothetical protein
VWVGFLLTFVFFFISKLFFWIYNASSTNGKDTKIPYEDEDASPMHSCVFVCICVYKHIPITKSDTFHFQFSQQRTFLMYISFIEVQFAYNKIHQSKYTI